jgi:ketosteroid isomerase-like protein
MYTEHGELFPPNEKIVEGRSAIEQFWKAAMDAGTKSVQLKTSEVEGYGEAAVDAGTYTLTGADGRLLDQGKYLVLWKRVDGKWRLHRDCWNSDMPIRKSASLRPLLRVGDGRLPCQTSMICHANR